MTIRLFLTPAGTWMADFVDDAEIRRLFGTTILPTPYTSCTLAAAVLAKIRERNPDAIVYLG